MDKLEATQRVLRFSESVRNWYEKDEKVAGLPICFTRDEGGATHPPEGIGIYIAYIIAYI